VANLFRMKLLTILSSSSHLYEPKIDRTHRRSCTDISACFKEDFQKGGMAVQRGDYESCLTILSKRRERRRRRG
jgi:hypothetical protein